MSLVQMAGGINESRVVTSKKHHSENDAVRLLGMLRNREQVFQAVADRMAQLSDQIDREHETIGVLLQTGAQPESGMVVKMPSENERLVLPRMGRLPYGIRFRSPVFLQALDTLHQKQDVTQRDLLQLFSRAARESVDHYETLLFMSYTVALVGLYPLADEYCSRALQAAEQGNRDDRDEALFLRALCGRIVARAPDRLREALAALEALRRKSATGDPRYAAEEGNIKLRWWQRSCEGRKSVWAADAPSFAAVEDALRTAVTLAQSDKRILVSIQNSLAYALTQRFVQEPSENHRVRVNDAIGVLIDKLRELEPDQTLWPIRVKDTILEAIVVLNTHSFDPVFVQILADSIERDLPSQGAIERRLLQRRIQRVRHSLTRGNAAPAKQ
jgi:hypothetical protein